MTDRQFRDQAILAALSGTIRARFGVYYRSLNTLAQRPTVTFQESLEAAVGDAVWVADLVLAARKRRPKSRDTGVPGPSSR
jgi:hypothetical protein